VREDRRNDIDEILESDSPEEEHGLSVNLGQFNLDSNGELGSTQNPS
jgi:hypothetical protein